jgi:hypothetical protein
MLKQMAQGLYSVDFSSQLVIRDSVDTACIIHVEIINGRATEMENPENKRQFATAGYRF